jgi:zinc protease
MPSIESSRTRVPRLAALIALLAGLGCWSESQAQANLQTYELRNGLHVILAPQETATTVEVNVWYDAGSRREPPGRSGFAHLFEHLMFQGSENLEPGLHSSLVTEAGGVSNAYLIVDNTSFFQTLPPDRYNLGLWLEAERMRSLRITEENMRREIEVVKEERRFSFENSPYGMSRLQAWFYMPYDSINCFPYAHSQIGSVEDLDASTLDDVQHFFDTYYVPNNATLTLAGAFDPAEARRLIERYFGGIPPSAEPPAVSCTDPFAHLPRRQTLEDANATLPAVMYSYGTVPARDPDSEALNLLVSILADGQSSRFNQRLVRDEQVALQATGFTWERLGPGIVWIFAVANQGVEVAELERLLDEEIDRVRREGVSDEELDKARNNYRASSVREQQTARGLAESFQWSNHMLGDPRGIAARLERLDSITSDDLRRVADRYLRPDNRAVVVTLPAGGGGGAQ